MIVQINSLTRAICVGILALASIVVFIGCDDGGSSSPHGPLFSLHTNGVTIRCPYAEFGDTGEVGDVTYTKRTAAQIQALATNAEKATDIERSCTSGITDMSNLFKNNTTFNVDISRWDTSTVENMSSMFNNAYAFNQNIGMWDVGAVTNMGSMFAGATAFEADIGNWNVAKVTSMTSMFHGASKFNQNLSGWCVSGIQSKPAFFDLTSVIAGTNQPKWGTCPK